MVAASLFIAISTFLAKGLAGRFDSLATNNDLHPLQITAGRFIFGFALWVVIAAIQRLRPRDVHWGQHLARSFFGWLTVSCIFWASAQMALSDATAISFLTPVFTLLLAALVLHERIDSARICSIIVMLTGALMALRPGSDAFQPAALIALVAAITGAVEILLIKRLTQIEPRIQILLVNNLFGCLIAVGASFYVWSNPTVAQWGLMAAVGGSMAVAQILVLTSMRGADASYVAPFIYATLIFAGLLDLWVFGDTPDALGIAGAAVIVLGAVLLAWSNKRAGDNPTQA